ncbi:D-isomer specific 2-hydroxyacid dehydrogenase family protein [Corynebacterium sp.]|jgi:phosphoglycerate dehydrogenase-like enzyme|uniref:D-isomer specific 2-hydroxyacid dehydrogenase family protein n=1 Tax=Corynebacterium sp. TaxID=1720 RepID=UPI0025B83D5E|nr:D-isomer specific 2-hydroxyacid dehydrogenase family protein [Corynebacterium sp.]
MKINIAAIPLPETAAALEAEGAVIVDDIADADAFLCVAMSPDRFPDLPERVKWVQLCQAGIEGFLDAGVVTTGPSGDRRWSNASGIYGRQVAEAAVGLLLSVTHMHVRIAREKTWSVWREVDKGTRWLAGSTVLIVGAGGIGRHLIDMLTPFGVEFIAVNHSGRPVDGARQTVAFDRLGEVLPEADHIILSAPLTDDTRGLIDADALASCRRGVTLVNVARGPVVVTDDLVDALNSGQVSGAGLDVTDPEPLPDGHPLWDMDNVTVTTHSANTVSSMDRQLAKPVVENYRAFLAGERMPTELDVDAAY